MVHAPVIANFSMRCPLQDVNFWGSVYPTHFAVPHLKKTGGRIVVNSSSAGWVAMPRMSFYNVYTLSDILVILLLYDLISSDPV